MLPGSPGVFLQVSEVLLSTYEQFCVRITANFINVMGAVNEFMDIIGLGSVGIGLCKGGVEVYKVAGRMPGGAPVSFRGIATGGSPIQMGALGAYSLFVRCLEVSKPRIRPAPD